MVLHFTRSHKVVAFCLSLLTFSALYLSSSQSQAQTLKTASGSANTFTLSLGQNLGGTYPAGLSFTFISNQTITGAATLNVNSTGAIPLVKNVNQPLVANDILAGQAVQVLYDGTNFQVMNVGSSATSTGSGISEIHEILYDDYLINTAEPVTFNLSNFTNNNKSLISITNPSETRFTALKTCQVNVSVAFSINVGNLTRIRKNGIVIQHGANTYTNQVYSHSSVSVLLNPGDYITVGATSPIYNSGSDKTKLTLTAISLNGSGSSSSTSSGISTLNGLTTTSQNFITSSTGTSVNIVSSGNTHNINIPLASVVGGNNITVTGSFPLYTISGLASTSTGAGTGNLHAFRAVLTSSQAVSTGATFPFDTEQYDTDNEYDPTNHVFIANEAGFYYMSAAIGMSGFPSIGFLVATIKQTNSSNVIIQQLGGSTYDGNGSGATYGSVASGVLFLNVGDKVFVTMDGNATNAEPFNATLNNASRCHFSGFKINGGGTLTVSSFIGGSSTTGISTLNGLTTTSQSFSTSSTGTSVNILSSGNTHNINIPLASVVGGNNITVTGSFPLYTVSGLASTATSQWVSTTGGILYSGGRVGIGIGNSVGLENFTDNFSYDSKTVGNYSLGWYMDSSNGFGPIGYFSSYGGLKFFTNGDGIPKLTILQNGFIGINTTLPGAFLDVNGSSRFATPMIISSFAGNGTQALGVNNLGQLVTIPGSSLAAISSLNGLTTTSQSFSTSSTGTSVNILSSGNTHNINIPLASVVGGNNITVTGSFPLYTVSGLASTATSQWVSTTGGIYYNSGKVGIGTSTPYANLELSSGLASDNTLGIFNTNSTSGNAGLELRSAASGGALQYIDFTSGSINQALPDFTNRISSSSNGLNLQTQSATGLFIQNSNAFVGIGTSSPIATLDINGNARVAGTFTISSFAGGGTQTLGVNNLGQLVTIAGATATTQWVNGTGGISYGLGNVSITGGRLNLIDFSGTAGGSQPLNIYTNDTWQSSFFLNNSTNVASASGWGFNLAGSGNTQVAPGSFSLYNNNYQFIMSPNGNLGLGSSINARYPASKLYVEGNAQITGPVTLSGLATGGATQALGVNNLGQLVTIAGTSSNYWTVSGTNLQPTSAFGINIASISGAYLIAGNEVVRINIGQSNAFLAGGGNNTMTGTNNLFSGMGAGQANGSGSYNVFSGGLAGFLNTAGSGNVFTGVNAGGGNTTGSQNSFHGYQAGYGNTNGSYNTFNGYQAGTFNTTGTGNTFQGSNSGTVNTTGNNNTFIGYQSNSATSGLNAAVAIGYNAIVGGNNMMALGGTGVDAVKVGIGYTTPSATLDVNGNARFVGPVSITGLATGGATAAVGVNSLGQLVTLAGTTTTQWVSTTGGSIFYNGGNVGIGTPTPTSSLHVFHTSDVGLFMDKNNATSAKNELVFAKQGTPVWTIGNDHLGLGNQNLYVYDVVSSQIRLLMDSNGKLGIGTGFTQFAPPQAQLDVNGNARFVGPVSITGLATGGATAAVGVNNLGQLVTISGAVATTATGFSVTNNVDLTLPTGASPTQMTFNNELYDKANAFNLGTDVYVVPVAGEYLFTAKAMTNNIGEVDILIFVNGTSVEEVRTSPDPSTGVYNTAAITSLLNLAINDVVDVRMRQLTGSNQTIYSNGGTTIKFSGKRIGD